MKLNICKYLVVFSLSLSCPTHTCARTHPEKHLFQIKYRESFLYAKPWSLLSLCIILILSTSTWCKFLLLWFYRWGNRFREGKWRGRWVVKPRSVPSASEFVLESSVLVSAFFLFIIIKNRKQHQHLFLQDKLNEFISGIPSRIKFHQLQLLCSNEKHVRGMLGEGKGARGI